MRGPWDCSFGILAGLNGGHEFVFARYPMLVHEWLSLDSSVLYSLDLGFFRLV